MNKYSVVKILEEQGYYKDGVFLDHKGNIFGTYTDMCNFYGISVPNFSHRILRGWELEKTLTQPPKISKKCKDYLGNEFNSTTEMCRYYGVEPTTFRNRIKQNWALEEALSKSKKENKEDKKANNKIDVKKLNKFCKQNNLVKTIVLGKLNEGFNYEDILKIDTKKAYEDCKYNCEKNNINIDVFQNRIRKGWGLKKASTISTLNHKCIIKDHLGNEFNSKKELFTFYDIDEKVFYARLRKGWSLERTLTEKNHFDNDYIDFLGQHYKSIRELGRTYNKQLYDYEERLKKYPQEILLTDKYYGYEINKSKNIRTDYWNDFICALDVNTNEEVYLTLDMMKKSYLIQHNLVGKTEQEINEFRLEQLKNNTIERIPKNNKGIIKELKKYE